MLVQSINLKKTLTQSGRRLPELEEDVVQADVKMEVHLHHHLLDLWVEVLKLLLKTTC